jgi:hypothetical protein
MPWGPEGGVEVQLYSSLNLGDTCGWVFNATPRPLYPRESPGTHYKGDWVGPRTGLELVRKISPPPEFDPRTVQSAESHYTDWASWRNVKGKGTPNTPKGPEGGRGISLHSLDLGARRGWWVSTTLRPLYSRERHGTHCTGGWVGNRAGLDVCEKSRPLPGFHPRTLDPTESHYTDWAIWRNQKILSFVEDILLCFRIEKQK